MKTIFILDDDMPILEALELWFRARGYIVQTYLDSRSFLQSMFVTRPDMILIDIGLGNEDGRQLCSLVKVKYRKRIPVILFSAQPSLGATYTDYDADAFIEKPFRIADLHSLVEAYLP